MSFSGTGGQRFRFAVIPGGIMRRLGLVASGLAMAIGLSGCAAFRNREWGACTVAGAIVGGAVGGITGGVVANNSDDADNATRGGAIAGGIVGGAVIGGLLGHLICDPVTEEPKPAPPAPSAPPPPPPPPPTERRGG